MHWANRRALSVFIASYPFVPSLQEKESLGKLMVALSHILPEWGAVRWSHLHSQQSLTRRFQSAGLLFAASQWIQDPKLWGPVMWDFLYHLATVFHTHKKFWYQVFIQNLGDVLPCEKCCLQFQTLIATPQVQLKLKTLNSPRHVHKLIRYLHRQVNNHL